MFACQSPSPEQSRAFFSSILLREETLLLFRAAGVEYVESCRGKVIDVCEKLYLKAEKNLNEIDRLNKEYGDSHIDSDVDEFIKSERVRCDDIEIHSKGLSNSISNMVSEMRCLQKKFYKIRKKSNESKIDEENIVAKMRTLETKYSSFGVNDVQIEVEKV